MKFFIVILGFTLLFGFSTSKLFIFRYRKLIEHWKLYEDKWENFVVENTETLENLCKELAASPIVLDKQEEYSSEEQEEYSSEEQEEYSSEEQEEYFSEEQEEYSSEECEYTEIEFETVVQPISVKVNSKKKTVSALPCQYNKSTVFLAKHANCEHLVLFEQEGSHIPSLSAVVLKPIEFEHFDEDTKEFNILLKKYNSIIGYHQWSKVKFPVQEEVKLFQLCMTLLMDFTKKKLAQKTVDLALSGFGSEKRRKVVVIDVPGFQDNMVSEIMKLPVVNYENIDEIDIPDIRYKVPTIQCTTANYSTEPCIMKFLFMPHPESTDNKIFLYYMTTDAPYTYLYIEDLVYSAVLKD